MASRNVSMTLRHLRDETSVAWSLDRSLDDPVLWRIDPVLDMLALRTRIEALADALHAAATGADGAHAAARG